MATQSELLEMSRKIIEEQKKQIERLTAKPQGYATVVGLHSEDRTVTVSVNGSQILIPAPDDLDLIVGDSVLLSQNPPAIVDVAPMQFLGTAATVSRIIDDEHVEIKLGGEPKIVFRAPDLELTEGDEAILESSMNVVVRVIKKSDNYIVKADVVLWDDIGGQADAKQAMIEAVEYPSKFPDLFKDYGKSASGGILLYGPPGCGKTMLGKAAATAISAKGDASGFMYIKGPEILDPYVGVAERTIRSIFKNARRYYDENGTPAVIFIDEADAILSKRGGQFAQMEKTIVPMFLAEMDGIEKSKAIVLLATNRPDTLDTAIIRDGRINRKIRVTRPNKEDCIRIFEIHLAKTMVLGSDCAAMAAEFLFNRKYRYAEYTVEGNREVHDMYLSDLASGSLVAGIVEKATSIALQRDIAAGRKRGTGITVDDLRLATKKAFGENRDVDHEAIIYDKTNGLTLTSLKKILNEA